MISRATLRGKKLDEDCQRANRASHQYGPEDRRVFCYGLEDAMTDELLDKCKNCKVNVQYAEAPKKPGKI